MSFRETIANSLLGFAIGFGESMGLRRTVELSDHSIELSLEQVDKDRRAWDTNLYKRGNVFVKGYANPIKPKVNRNAELENPDTIDVTEGNDGQTEDAREDDEDNTELELIASPRYQSFMRQDLISQLLNPESQWRILVFGIIALGILNFVGMIITLYGTGAF